MNTSEIERELHELEQRLAREQQRNRELEGQRDQLVLRLADSDGCSSHRWSVKS